MAASAPYDVVVLISIDTLRADCLATEPDKKWLGRFPRLHAPSAAPLDTLAAEGAAFTNVISAAPYTGASHGSFFSGRWPLRHGAYEFFNGKLFAPTLFTAAQDAGWRTLFKTDFPIILGEFLGFDRGVDDYFIEDDDAFLTSLQGALGEKAPVLAFAHFGGAHIPYGFHSYAKGGEAYREHVAALEAEIGRAPPSPVDRLVETFRTPEDLELLVRYKGVVQQLYAAAEYERLFELYLRGVDRFFAAQFAPFLDRLRELLAGRRALIVAFGDHGEEYDADSYGHHNSMSDTVLRVPLVFWGEDVPAAPPQRHRVRSIDLAPTLAARLGLWPLLRGVDGVSLEPWIWGETTRPPPERRAYAQSWVSDTQRFVDYQKTLLNGGDVSAGLPHVLLKEAAYDGDWRMVVKAHEFVGGGGIFDLRQTDRAAALEVRRDNRYGPASDEARQAALQALLSAYNALREAPREVASGTERIADELRASGYSI